MRYREEGPRDRDRRGETGKGGGSETGRTKEEGRRKEERVRPSNEAGDDRVQLE